MGLSVGTYSEGFPTSWEYITESFLDLIDKEVSMPPVYDINFLVRNGQLFISYRGGNKSTDAYALFARELSKKICGNCGATRDAGASVVNSFLCCQECI